MRGEPQLVQETSDRLSAVSAEHGLTDWLYWAECLRGWAIAMQGRHEEGIAKIRENQDALAARGLGVWRPYFFCLLADAYLCANRVDDGLRIVTEAVAVAEEHQERAHESQIYRLKGELLLKLPDPDLEEARESFERASRVAQIQEARSFELCATTSLARLVRKRDDREAAYTRLKKIYNWFSEGFETASLKQARALLDELRSVSKRLERSSARPTAS